MEESIKPRLESDSTQVLYNVENDIKDVVQCIQGLKSIRGIIIFRVAIKILNVNLLYQHTLKDLFADFNQPHDSP